MEYDYDFGWSREQTLLFIELMKDTPVVWSYKHKDHYNKEKRRDGWERLSRQLRVGVSELKKKWESLQASFRREKRKFSGFVSGTEADEVWMLESKWFAYDALSYLLQNDGRRKVTNVSGSVQETSKIESSPSNTPRRKKIIIEEDKPPDEGFPILKTAPRSNIDEAQMFGNLIALKLRNSDPLRRSYIQLQIMQIFHNEELKTYRTMEEYSNKSVSMSHSASRVYNDHTYNVVTEYVIPARCEEVQEVFTEKC